MCVYVDVRVLPCSLSEEHPFSSTTFDTYPRIQMRQGNFVWKKEQGGADPWLASLDNEEDLEATIGEAAQAQKRRWVLVSMYGCIVVWQTACECVLCCRSRSCIRV